MYGTMGIPTGPPPAGQSEHTIMRAIVPPENLKKRTIPRGLYNRGGQSKHTVIGTIVRPESPEKTHN